ncbi:MAG: hypothetical protein KatS3mg043_1250 [Rhodothermaceae bacterium]|nr:MAG: hypothetical protein KatS3mg043_1250 [Rhodothermaceae bacterium]
MNLLVFAAVLAAMLAVRFFLKNLHILAWLALWWVALFVVFKYGIEPPLPASIVNMFMAIVTLALLAYLSATTSYLRQATEAVVRFMVDRRFTVPLVVVLLAVPALVAWQVYAERTARPTPPVSGRTIHPPPPNTISFKGKTIDLVNGENPYRALETSDPEAFAAHVENGRRIYYENCVFCHGDNMEGDGLFAHGYDPLPANFNDPTTIAMLQETYLFWRIAKGGPGLPSESTPWASAMPAWENFLTEEEIWDVILFLYDYTGFRPRAREEIH